jgi:hypothetical protein
MEAFSGRMATHLIKRPNDVCIFFCSELLRTECNILACAELWTVSNMHHCVPFGLFVKVGIERAAIVHMLLFVNM